MFNNRSCLKREGGELLSKTQDINFYTTYVNMYAWTQAHRHTHTHRATPGNLEKARSVWETQEWLLAAPCHLVTVSAERKWSSGRIEFRTMQLQQLGFWSLMSVRHAFPPCEKLGKTIQSEGKQVVCVWGVGQGRREIGEDTGRSVIRIYQPRVRNG